MVGHTPGPWAISHQPDTANRQVDDAAGRQITYCPVHCKSVPLPEAQANARLIAAAPELLAACKLALETAENWIHDQLDGTSMVEPELADLEPVRQAIAKAEGR